VQEQFLQCRDPLPLALRGHRLEHHLIVPVEERAGVAERLALLRQVIEQRLAVAALLDLDGSAHVDEREELRELRRRAALGHCGRDVWCSEENAIGVAVHKS
jgi:hypothetical protein